MHFKYHINTKHTMKQMTQEQDKIGKSVQAKILLLNWLLGGVTRNQFYFHFEFSTIDCSFASKCHPFKMLFVVNSVYVFVFVWIEKTTNAHAFLFDFEFDTVKSFIEIWYRNAVVIPFENKTVKCALINR